MLVICGIALIAATMLVTGALVIHFRNQSILLLGAGIIVALVICLIVLIAAREIVKGIERSKRSLQDQKRKLDAALNHMSQGLCMFDPAARLVLCNARYLQMYDLSPDAIAPDCTLRDLLERRKAVGSFSGDVPTYVSELSASIAQGKEARRLSESSGGRIIEIVNQPMAGGGWIATHNDITQQRRAERERDRNREFLNAVIENVPTTIFVRDARERRYLLVNRSAETMWGMPREKIIGRTPRELFPEKIADMIARHDDSLLRSNTELLVEEHELRMRNNGTRLIKAKRISIRNESGEPQYLLGMLEDVTESRAVEQQLQQSQKMEAVGNLTGGLAHDFNNLLTIMIGNLDLLQSELAGNRAAGQKVATILQAAERGADLTHQLLAFSRRQHLSPRHIDVNDLISNTARLLGRTLGENITFDLRLVDDPWPLIADAGQLEAALVNIAINARDAMPDGGVLTIVSEKSHLDADYSVHHPEVTAGDYVKIELRDTGAGMAPDVLARIFEPFFTTKAPGKGTGLGLSMVYGFMKQSGGHLSAESKVGEGTTFKLYLPRAAAAGAKSAGPEAHAAAPAADGKVILVVDDNPAVRATVLLQLKALGHSVYEADNALSALTMLDDVEEIDLLFTDIVMPGAMNGRELAAKARARRPDLKVLYTSGFPGAFAGDGADDRDALLNKPYRRRDLANAIHRVLQTGS